MKRTRRPYAFRRWAIVGLYLAAIFVQSALPSSVYTASFPGLDKLLHALAYGLLAALWCRALTVWPLEGRPAAAIAAAAAILAALYGLSDEIHQAFVPGRMADPWDWMADGFGAVIGAAAWAMMLN
jgi:VanZ family protein